ncbi:ATP-binding cassette domain-containing protein, partial [Pectobacterium polaris]|nr:ATP-binding cassette domain-containing protein [Pectobacterium polaris]
MIESCRPDKSWPAQGRVTFKNYSTKYKTQRDPALKNINIDIKPQEKIGVVGRTGAGKSTLSLALFRLLEATSGSIKIDGIDISRIGLADLRSRLGIIPQDAQAFEGSIRSNLDPFQRYSTETLWKAIELSHLAPHIVAMCQKENKNGHQATPEEMLETKITENG